MPGLYAAMLFTPPSTAPETLRRWRRRGRSRRWARPRAGCRAAARRLRCHRVPGSARRTAGTGCPAAPLRGGRRGRVELAPGQQRLDLGRELCAEQLALARSGGGDNMLPVTDGHGAAQPPGQHVRIDGGRLAKLGQRRILLNMTPPFPSV